jgi:hypothetical protein
LRDSKMTRSAPILASQIRTATSLSFPIRIEGELLTSPLILLVEERGQLR